jgi:hypothetical protein
MRLISDRCGARNGGVMFLDNNIKFSTDQLNKDKQPIIKERRTFQ